MKEQHIPLFGLESQEPLTHFDFIGITIQYEMCYTNILRILDLARIPLLAKRQRTGYAVCHWRRTMYLQSGAFGRLFLIYSILAKVKQAMMLY